MRRALLLLIVLVAFAPKEVLAQDPEAAPAEAEVPEGAPPEGAPPEGAPPEGVGGAQAGAAVEAGPGGEAIAAAEEEAPFDPKAYAAELRKLLPLLREKVEVSLEDKLNAKAEAQTEMIGEILRYVALAGFLLLLIPVFLGGRYPGKAGLLFKQSALAGLLFWLAVNLLSLALLLLRSIQGGLAAISNPQIAMVGAFFDTLDKNAEDLAAFGPTILEPTLEQLQGGDQSAPVLLLENLDKLQNQASVFKTLAGWLKGLDWLFGALPTVMALVAVALFVVSFKPLLTDIVMLPIRAARGEVQVGAGALAKETMRKVGREFLAVFGMIGVLIVLTLISGSLLSVVVGPAIEALVAFLLVAFIYLQVEPAASTGLVLVSVGTVLALLVTLVLVVIVGNVLYLSRAQKIFRQRFHDKVRLGAHRTFWTRGSWWLIWSQLLPVLSVAILAEVLDPIFSAFMEGDKPSFLPAMLIGGASLLGGFLLLFWLGRGLRAMRSLARYDVKAAAETAAAKA